MTETKKSNIDRNATNFGMTSEKPSAKFKAKQNRRELSLRLFMTNIPVGIGKEGDKRILFPLGKNPSTDGHQIIVSTTTNLTEETMRAWKLISYEPKSKRPLTNYYAVDPEFMKEATVVDPFNRAIQWLLETELCSDREDALALVKEYISKNTPKPKNKKNKGEMKADTQNGQTHETHVPNVEPTFQKIPAKKAWQTEGDGC